MCGLQTSPHCVTGGGQHFVLNENAQICSYQLPVSVHDADNANEASGMNKDDREICQSYCTAFCKHHNQRFFSQKTFCMLYFLLLCKQAGEDQ